MFLALLPDFQLYSPQQKRQSLDLLSLDVVHHGRNMAMALGVPPPLSSSNSSFPPLQSGMKRLQNNCIAAIRRGPVPQHIAIIMDGNRRYARSSHIDTAEGHYAGAETLKNVFPNG